jgi:hypothetical protein
VIGARLYGNMALTGRLGAQIQTPTAIQPWLHDRITWNCVQASLDTVTARIAKNKPRPLFQTSGGDYKMQRRAKSLTKFVEGVFYENDAYALGPLAFRDGGIWGDGVIHVCAYNRRVKFERVMAAELHVDDLDGFYGHPRSLHRVTIVDRAVLLETAASWLRDEKDGHRNKVLDAIRDAPLANPDQADQYLADTVELRESWHLPSGPDAGDGLHCLTIEGCVVYSREWKRDSFPFARFQWSPRPYGFWGQGLAEQLQNNQLEINTILRTIQQSFWKGGTLRVFLQMGSRIVKSHMTNQIGSVVEYAGTQPPSFATPQLVQPEVFSHLYSIWQHAFEQAGVSQMASMGQKPAGLNSGKALREYNDLQTDRFMTIGQAYERLFLDLARLSIETVKDIGGKYKVIAPMRGTRTKEIDFNDVNLKEDSYIMQCFPVSSLPNEPAGRMATIEEWVQAGWISPRVGRRLMDMPDLEMAESLATSAEDFLTEQIERMLDEDGFFYAPEPFDDLALANELGRQYYNVAKLQAADERSLEKLRRFMLGVFALEEKGKQAAEAEAVRQAQIAQSIQASGQPQGQGGTPQARPAKAPVSTLLPQTA